MRGSVIRTVVVILALVLAPLVMASNARADDPDVSPGYFIDHQQYSRLISDSDFINHASWSVNDIQSFLQGKGSYLAIASPDQLGENNRGRSAAQIIYDAAQGLYDAGGSLNGINIDQSTGTINPRAIVITLQKEQSLITIGDYQPSRLNTAMGYGCPDSGGCNPNYSGFTRQVEWASWQLRYNYEIAGKDSSWWSSHYGSGFQYRVGNGQSLSYSFSSPSMSGTVTVSFNNQATAGLYRYTPHITYGNYNFWKLSRSWFGMSGEGGSTSSFNDTSAVSLRTYGSSVKVQASKESAAKVYFNSQLVADAGSTSWSHQFTPDLGQHTYSFEFRDGSGNVIGTKSVDVDRHKSGDINGSGRVDLADLSLLSNSWATTVQGDDWRNLNPETDNEINLLDMSIFANNWEG